MIYFTSSLKLIHAQACEASPCLVFVLPCDIFRSVLTYHMPRVISSLDSRSHEFTGARLAEVSGSLFDPQRLSHSTPPEHGFPSNTFSADISGLGSLFGGFLAYAGSVFHDARLAATDQGSTQFCGSPGREFPQIQPQVLGTGRGGQSLLLGISKQGFLLFFPRKTTLERKGTACHAIFIHLHGCDTTFVYVNTAGGGVGWRVHVGCPYGSGSKLKS